MTGGNNTATGVNALASNISGIDNTALGNNALANNTVSRMTAVGYNALGRNTTGAGSTAVGYNALAINTTGSDNTAVGYQALLSNTTGNDNTAIGLGALQNNTTGSVNVALGFGAGDNQTNGGGNVYIGYGMSGVAGEYYKTYISNIYGTTSSGGLAVYVDSAGLLGTTTSSARFKRDIHDMGAASDALLALRPVTFRYKAELDPAGLPQFGLVAEEVEKVNPALIVRDTDGKPYSVRYEQVNAMLLNEFLKEHKKVQAQERKAQEQEATIAQLKKGMEVLTASLKEQAAQIQKVSAQLAVSKPAPQMVVNNR